MVHEVKNFHSEVLTDGGALMREEERIEAKQRKQEQQEREAIAQEAREAKEAQSALQREREEGRRAQVARQEARRLAAEERALKDQAAAKHIAEQAAAKAASAKADEENRQAAKEARKLEFARIKEEQAAKQAVKQETAQPAPRKSSMHALLDDLGDKPSAKPVPSAAPVPVFDHGVAHIPSSAPALLGMESDINASTVQSLNHILPGPIQVLSASLPESVIKHESGEEVIARVLDSDDCEEESSEIRSKRGKERVQRLLQEKRALETQLAEMQALVAHLQGTAEQDEEEPTPASQKAAEDKKQAALVNDAKLEMLRFLNSRESEVDHLEKVNCFYRYMTNPFYMHTFVQNNRPDEWQSVMEYIYDAIEKPVPPKAKRSSTASTQPIRSRTSTLGAPLVHASKPIERITEHLSNMGI
jgi:hypothetical protein